MLPPGEDPDELPSTVEELAASQIDQLPQRSVHCYGEPQYSAMNSRGPAPADVQDVAPERSGTELLAGLSGLIVSTGHQLRFRHPILREVAYAGLPYKRRRELHAKAAEVLEATTAAADRRPEILALHYFVARNYDKAMDYGWRAGERAMARYAPAAAADAYRRAAQAARLSSASARASVRSTWKRWAMQSLAGRPTEAAAAYLEALRWCAVNPTGGHLALKQTWWSNAAAITPTRCAGRVLACVQLAARQVRGGRHSCRLQARYAFCRPTGSLCGCPPVGGARPRRSRGGP